MNKAELESKSLGDLHSLAAEAGVERYRMLSRGELVAKLAGESGGGGNSGGRKPQGQQRSESRQRQGGGEQRQRPPRRRRSGSGAKAESGEAPSRQRQPREKREPAAEPTPTPAAPEPAATPAESSSRPKRRRRRFGRRGKQSGVTLQGLLSPPEAGRQAVLVAESRAACTTLLRGIAADLAGDSKGPDPVILLIDPSPEELADWKRDAPQAEIVAAGQPRHASDALGQAAARAGKGEDVILLVDSLTRLAEAHDDAEAAKTFFDAGRVQGSTGGGSLTVVAALERPS